MPNAGSPHPDPRQVFGHWVIRSAVDGSEVHRIASHHPYGCSSWEKADRGVERKVDLDRFDVEWEDAEDA